MGKVRGSDRFTLDELDLMLAKELEQDARQSNRFLSKKIGINEATLKRRVKRLQDKKAINYITKTDRHLLGLHNSVILGLSVRRGMVDKVVERLRSRKRIRSILLTTGRYDIVIDAMLHDNRELVDFFDEELGKIPYLTNVDKIIFLETMKSSLRHLNADTNRYVKPAPANLDSLDLDIVRELELNPRESVMNLAKKLGVNRWLIGNRLKALLANRVIQVFGLLSPSYLGLKVRVFIFVNVQPGKVRSVAENLIIEKRVQQIHIITGSFDLFLVAIFPDMEELSDFLKNHLGSYSGVVSHETMIQVSCAKHSLSLLT